MNLRWAVLAEREALGELYRRSSFVWPEDRANLQAHPEVLGVAAEAINEQRVRVAAGLDGTLLGFSVVAVGGSGAYELDDLFVDPPVMRRGIGRALAEDAASRASAAGYGRMTVIAHPRNFPSFESLGFVVIGPAQTRFGLAARLAREPSGTAGN